jgi:hypothetical protein
VYYGDAEARPSYRLRLCVPAEFIKEKARVFSSLEVDRCSTGLYRLRIAACRSAPEKGLVAGQEAQRLAALCPRYLRFGLQSG